MRTESALVALPDLLALQQLDDDGFRAPPQGAKAGRLYGGLVAAQALVAAGRTVDPDRLPHSLHGYYLRGGDPGLLTTLRVTRDRDGNSFSARRVEAVQDGRVLFTMAASFHCGDTGMDVQPEQPPTAGDPGELDACELPVLVSMEFRLPVQPYPTGFLPTRYWARCTAPLPVDPLVHAGVLTYLSDMSSGLIPLRDGPWRPSPTLDHGLWFHRPVRMDRWVLMDLVPRSVAAGRGWYTGSIHTGDGVHVASLAQEALFGRMR